MAQEARPPCATCVWLAVTPSQLIALPESLQGLHVLVSVPRGEEEAALTALGRVRAAGARAGILVNVMAEAADAGRLAFDLKTSLTAFRAAAPEATLALAAPAAVRRELAARGIGAYVDLIADLGPPLRSVLDSTQGESGRPQVRSLPADVVDARNLAADLVKAAPWLPPSLIPLKTPVVGCEGRAGRAFLDPSTLATIAVLAACPPGAPLDLPAGTTGAERLALSTGALLVRIPPAAGHFAEDVRVVGAPALSVQEVIARHQAAVARQRAAVSALISRGAMTLTFEAPGFSAPVAISSETVIYAGGGRTEIEQRRVRVNGIEFRGGAVPRLPIIEPERAAAPPLAITLTDAYRYALAGEEVIDGTRCHVVLFEPAEAGAMLFRGRAWIAAGTFGMVKVAASQTGLRGPIVSSEQIDEFDEHEGGIRLLRRSEVRQMYEGAGHRTPIHRVTTIDAHEVNPADFRERRAAAYASATVMLRDTPEGYRYLRRDPGDGKAGGPVEPAIASRADRVRTAAMGVIVDPNISRPLPFAGLSYADFDLFGTGTQLTAFFGGTYGQVAVSVPAVRGSRWQLAGRAFAIASSYNDRAFVDGRERYDENIRQRPAHAAVWALRPLTARTSFRAGYELDYTQFGAADVTGAGFIVPADQVAHSLRLGLDSQWRGWHLAGSWAATARRGWRPWGSAAPDGGTYRPSHDDYQRYAALAARPFVLSPRLVARIEGGWMAGRDLDRFSRYAFGTFDNRLRGYPSALIRYDRGGVVRGAMAWAAARVLRVDGFLDTAYVHDPGFGEGLRRFTGLGAAVEAPAPFGTLVALEWGYGFEGVRSDGRRGTQVVRVTGFKIF